MIHLMLFMFAFVWVGVSVCLLAFPDSSLWMNCLIGSWVGVLIWLFWYWRQYQQFLIWLRKPSGLLDLEPKGIWSDLMERIMRLHRDHAFAQSQSESRMNQFFEAIQASPNGVIFLDQEDRIEWLNWTASEQLGIDLDKDRYQIIGNLLRDPDFHGLLTSQTDESVVIHSRGEMQQSRRRFALRLFPYGEGRKLLLSTDVTQVELAESMRQQFVANVSHEIRTPLTVILGLIETLKNIKLSESDRVRLIAMLEDHSNRMNSLVSDLLTLSQIEGTPLPDPQEHFDLHEMLTEAIEAAGSYSRVHANQQSEPHAFTLHWKLSERLIWFKGHRSELLSAVTNLLTNAIRYSFGGSIIELTAIHLSESDFGISVQDHGIGIPPDHLPRLTERFYRVDSSRSRTTGGTGLGLSIVKHVVQRHGGSIDIRSQLGKGSTFTLVFPLTRLIQGSHQ